MLKALRNFHHKNLEMRQQENIVTDLHEPFY